MIEGFQALSDIDINRNSVDFIYWYSGSGMAEFVIEQNERRLPIRSFQRQETAVGKALKDIRS